MFRLQCNKVTIFKAHLQTDSREESIDGELLKKGEAKYVIKKVYKSSARKWPHYDKQKHEIGSEIVWRKKFAVKTNWSLNLVNDVSSSVDVTRGAAAVSNVIDDDIGVNNQMAAANSKTQSTSNNDTGCNEDIEKQKPMLTPCSCRLNCSTKIAPEKREEIHSCYWRMSYMEKRFYLVQSIRLHKPRHRTGSAPADTDASNQKRAYTRVYQFGEVIVCKKFFMKTLGYTSDKFITVALKGVDNETGEVNTVCGQGTYDHKKTHGILEADKKFIEQHVKEKCISLLTFKRFECYRKSLDLNLQYSHNGYVLTTKHFHQLARG